MNEQELFYSGFVFGGGAYVAVAILRGIGHYVSVVKGLRGINCSWGYALFRGAWWYW